MKTCDACQALDGKPSRVAPHADLAYMTEYGGGVSGLRPMMKSWRCQRCDTWLRQHTEYGEKPGLWEALIQLNPWFENGYQVYGAVQTTAVETVEGWYRIEVPATQTHPRAVTFTSVRVGVFKTEFAALYAALLAGKYHARKLRSL